MKQVLTPSGLIATPKSLEDLHDYMMNLSDPAERQLALTIAGMTWNLASKLVDEATQEVTQSSNRPVQTGNMSRDTWEYKLYEALSNVMEGVMRHDEDIPEKDKEHALRIMNQWESDARHQ